VTAAGEAPTLTVSCSAEHALTGAWPFHLPVNAAIFTVKQVLAEDRPLVYVAHTAMGWEALPDGGPFDPLEDGSLVCLACLYRRNPSLHEVADLPLGWSASRVVGGPWQRERAEGGPGEASPGTSGRDEAEDTRLAAVYRQRIEEQDRTHEGYARMWSQLTVAILVHGGRHVVPPRRPDPLVLLLAHQGERWQAAVRPCPGMASSCHRNAVELWRQGTATAIGTGYGLSDDGLWREHSWGVASDGSVLETTEPRTTYFGVALRDEGADRIARMVGG
jgi:hypothetical protein